MNQKSDIRCKVENCEKEVMYKGKQLCQMHYFRWMRNGYFEKKSTRKYPQRGRKYRILTPNGYQKLYEPTCPLSDGTGNVYEHRFIYFNEISKEVSECCLCGNPVTWDTCHIDHIDENKKNNSKENLRCLCRACNVFRGHTNTSMGKTFITIDGVTKTPTAWSRTKGVTVCAQTIRRRKIYGYSDFDAVYAVKKTHVHTVSAKTRRKYDQFRGIQNTDPSFNGKSANN